MYAFFSNPVLFTLIFCVSTNCEANHCVTFSILLLFLPLRSTKSHQSTTYQLFTQQYNAKFSQDFLCIMWLVNCNSHLLLCCSNHSFSLLPGYLTSTEKSVETKQSNTEVIKCLLKLCSNFELLSSHATVVNQVWRMYITAASLTFWRKEHFTNMCNTHVTPYSQNC